MKLNIVVEISNDIEIDKNVSHKLKIALSQWQFPIRPDAIVWVWVLAHPSICASHDDAFDRFTVQYFIYKLCISFVVCWWDADTTPLTTSQIIIRDIFRECHAPIGRYVPAPCRCDLMTVQFEFSAAIPHLLPAWFNGRFGMKCTSLATICFLLQKPVYVSSIWWHACILCIEQVCVIFSFRLRVVSTQYVGNVFNFVIILHRHWVSLSLCVCACVVR